MPYTTDWLQPDDMWVSRPVLVEGKRFFRYLSWLPDDFALPIATRDARWSAMFTAATAEWESLTSGDEWPSAESSESVSASASPSTQISSVGWVPSSGASSSFSTAFHFAELAADTSTDDHHVYVPPDLPPGATVEYETTEGDWKSDYRFGVRSALSSSSPDVQSKARTLWASSGGVVGASTYPGPGWRSWPALPSTAQETTHIIETGSSVVTVMPVYTAHITGVHDTVFGAIHRLFANSAGGSVPPSAWRRYTPSRYRVTYPDDLSGYWTTRQRQTLSGNTGGWPLRQRHNGGHSGSGPLRQRQTGL